MKKTSLASVVEGHAFFRGMDQGMIELVSGCARNARFKAGEVLARQGEPADRFYLIREGRAAIQIPAPHRGAILIQTLEKDDIAGWSWLMPPHRWQFDVLAVTPLRVLTLDGACLRQKCEADAKLGYELMKRFAGVMAERLQATRLQLLDLYDNPSASALER